MSKRQHSNQTTLRAEPAVTQHLFIVEDRRGEYIQVTVWAARNEINLYVLSPNSFWELDEDMSHRLLYFQHLTSSLEKHINRR